MKHKNNFQKAEEKVNNLLLAGIDIARHWGEAQIKKKGEKEG